MKLIKEFYNNQLLNYVSKQIFLSQLLYKLIFFKCTFLIKKRELIF